MLTKKNRYTNQELDILRDFIHTYINTDIQVQRSDNYECDTYDDIIFISNKRYSKITDYFMQYWNTRPEWDNSINHNLIAILHEVGHIETFDEEEQEESNYLKGIYEFIYNQGAITLQEWNYSYFKTPIEENATLWAIDFYKKHKDICNKLVKDLKI